MLKAAYCLVLTASVLGFSTLACRCHFFIVAA
jgi:hypothetical protein